jgi:signal transduction histidine kinase
MLTIRFLIFSLKKKLKNFYFLILVFFLCPFYAQQQSKQNQNDLEKTLDSTQRFEYLDSLALALEAENYKEPYEKTLVESIKIGKQIDSLDRVANQAIGLSWYYNNIVRQPEKSIQLNRDILKLDQSKITDFNKGLLHRELADAYYFTGQNIEALQEYEIAIHIFEELQDDQSLAETLMYISAPQSDVGDFINAINSMDRSLKLFEKTGDQYNITGMRIEMALLYSKYGFIKEAREQYDKLLEEGFANESQLSVVFINLANMAKDDENFEDHFEFLKRAEKLAKNSDRDQFILPAIVLTKANTYFSLNETKKANQYLNKFEKKYSESKKAFASDYKSILAEKYKSEKKIDKAINEYEELIQVHEENQNWSKVVDTRKELTELYKNTGQFDLALMNQTRLMVLKDSIENDKKIKALTFYKAKFETEKKDKQINQQESKIEILDLENKNKQKVIAIISSLALMVIIGIWLFRNYIQTKREKELQQNFSQRLLSAQEDERLSISRDLHDSVGQSLSLIKRETQQRNMHDIDKLMGTALQDLRNISQSIYPYTLKNFGLSYAIQQLISQIEKSTELSFKLKIQDITLKDQLALNIYRLVQEALNNIVKHANASSVEIIIMKTSNRIVVKVLDDGEGFDVNYKLKTSKSFGLQTMQQRIQMIKGKLEMRSTEQGTVLEALIPLS